MPFTLTHAHVKSLLDPIAESDWSHFGAAIDPQVHWTIVDPIRDPIALTGTYNLQEWTEKVSTRLASRLQGIPSMKIDSLDVVGQKAIIESTGSAMQKNGKPYNNKYCWILTFSEETGKIVAIGEYLNSALVKEVMETNEGL